MGRRKIEIKAIKDDRNRSVTFLKRKGGLFKKAYELSVLCSADVAIIIFGNNKKLYEFSSGNIDEIIERRNFFGLPHERKGPDDYQGKGSDNEDDEEDVNDGGANGMRQSNSPPLHQRTNSNHYAHPMNGQMNGRHLTPQPMSRPLSRNAQHPQHPHHGRNLSHGAIMGPNGPPMGHHPGMGPGPANGGFTYVNQYPAPVSQPPVQTIPPGYSFQPANGPAQAFLQQQQQQHENMMRRTSMPGAIPQHHPAPQQEHSTPPHIAQEQSAAQPQIQIQNDQGADMEPEAMQEDPSNDNIARARTKSRSIFTPIAGESSLLAQHWFQSSPVRANSVDNGALSRKGMHGESSIKHEITAEPEEMDPRALPLIRTGTGDIQPPTRTPSLISTPGGGLKRPILKVQIPNDDEEDGTAANTAGTSPRNSGLTADPISARPHTEPLPPGAVLPPPSPSVGNNAPLSAGGSGPGNPFARPPPTSAVHNGLEQTPISALPSRFMENMLPSPSSFFGGDWDGNMLPSPLNFKTPILGRNNFTDEDNSNKRKSPDSMDIDSNGNKRVKT